MHSAALLAKESHPSEILVCAIHPSVDAFIKEASGLPEDADIRGIGGIRNIMVTDSVDGFAVVICNQNL